MIDRPTPTDDPPRDSHALNLSNSVARLDPKERFSTRVADYVRYRPGYPDALVSCLVGVVREAADIERATVADVGSGTGILTRKWLDALGPAARVIAIEPNRAMRAAAEETLGADPRFTSVDASAEATGLPDASVDLVVAAQAFHWFDPQPTRAEFARILNPTGIVALVWNQRSDTALNRDYEEMLERFAPEYADVREKDRASDEKIGPFFAPDSPRKAVFDNEQRFDEAGIKGRLLSSSYCPPVGDLAHQPIMNRLGEIYRAHARDGLVTFSYDTVVWYGNLSRRG